MNGEIVDITSKVKRAVIGQQCPECGARMTEVDRHYEQSALFIWFECSRPDCDGQWLKRIKSNSVYSSNSLS